MIYGKEKTVHQTKHVHVEVAPMGHVVAVWFRCASLPFEEVQVDNMRASQMEDMYKRFNRKGIEAIEFGD